MLSSESVFIKCTAFSLKMRNFIICHLFFITKKPSSREVQKIRQCCLAKYIVVIVSVPVFPVFDKISS